MDIFLTNTLTRKKEKFIPIDESNVRMYACGPTVYDRPHLGNARAAVVYDLLYRLLSKVYSKVEYARNITDVDDKIINAVKASGEEMGSLTRRITEYYNADVQAIGCVKPNHEPKASEYIPQMISMMQILIEKGHAYVADNHVLFSVQSFKEYGFLANRSRDEMIAGARVEVAPYKKDPADFVLWKPSPEHEYDYGFDSPWGRGRPGWHIECSAMSRDLLGEVFDIHGGGADLMFPHHENECAQSMCSSHSGKFVNYWVHNGFLMVEGEKMSKSLGNFKTVREVLDEGVKGNVVRYLYLTTHYRKPLDFTKKALEDSAKAIAKFTDVLESAGEVENADDTEFLEILADDLNTPLILAKLHEYAAMYQKGDKSAAAKIKAGAELIGLDLSAEKIEIPAEIKELADSRLKAKSEKNWALSDSLRAQIEEKGFALKDTKDGYELKKK